MKAAVLQPNGPFSELPRSDTVFGAICRGLVDRFGEKHLESLLADFSRRRPPFRISSAFPAWVGDDLELFFPMPQFPSLLAGVDDRSVVAVQSLKRWGQTSYVSHGVFTALVNGAESLEALIGPSAATGPIEIAGKQYHWCGEFLQLTTHDQPPITVVERPRVGVNRLTSATDEQFFYDESVHFHPEAGLVVYCDGDLETVRNGLEMVKNVGIGGNRSLGQGTFDILGIHSVDMPEIDGEYVCTLSICLPHESEIDRLAANGFYELESRQGFVSERLQSKSAVWKARVRGFSEGSLLPRRTPLDRADGWTARFDTVESYGHNPIVQESKGKQIQQYGYALPVAIDRLTTPEVIL